MPMNEIHILKQNGNLQIDEKRVKTLKNYCQIMLIHGWND